MDNVQASQSAAAAAATAAATSDHLVKKIFYRKDELLNSLATPEFYIQVLVIGMALALAWLVALLIRRRIVTYLKQHPPKKIDAHYLTTPLSLLGPTIALLYLSVARPIANAYSENVLDLMDAVVRLTITYFFAKIVLMIVSSRPVAYFIAFVLMLLAVLDVTGFLHSTAAYLAAMAFSIGDVHISILNLLHGLVILVIVFYIAGILSNTLESYLRRSSSLSYNARLLTVKFFRIFVYFTALLITLSAMGVDLTAFAVFGGALGVGIGLGLQKITANFVSGVTLLLEKSVQMNDLIEVAGYTGWVRELNVRYTLIETQDGREVMIPNDELASSRVVSWTHSSNHARIDISIGVDYSADPSKVIELMLQSARAHPRCLKDPAPTCFLREFGDSALKFLLIFWIGDIRDGRMGPQSDIMISILAKFKEAGIDIPYPHQVQVIKGPSVSQPG